MVFHEKLMELRKSRGMSQEELGYKLNVTRQTVSKWETGQTTPEMDKLIELSRLFGISMDELAGKENTGENPSPVYTHPRVFHYEYKSKKMLFGLPLVHINVGGGLRKAKGIIAFGNIARGIISFGAVSVGVISFGAVSVGLLALGALGVGLAAFAGISVGAVALGGVAVGLLSIGGVAVGVYSIGGFAFAANIAMGGLAQGHIAIGDIAKGDFAWEKMSELTDADYEVIRSTILREYPNIWRWILNLFA